LVDSEQITIEIAGELDSIHAALHAVDRKLLSI